MSWVVRSCIAAGTVVWHRDRYRDDMKDRSDGPSVSQRTSDRGTDNGLTATSNDPTAESPKLDHSEVTSKEQAKLLDNDNNKGTRKLIKRYTRSYLLK